MGSRREKNLYSLRETPEVREFTCLGDKVCHFPEACTVVVHEWVKVTESGPCGLWLLMKKMEK